MDYSAHYFGLTGLARLLLMCSVMKSWDDERGEVTFTVDPDKECMLSFRRISQIQQAISNHVGRPMRVIFEWPKARTIH